MAEIGDLVPIDDNNTARWPEGMAPSGVNDAGRADEGIMSRWHRDTNGSLTSAGTGAAYTLTTNQSLTAYYDGLEITFVAHTANSASPTLQLGALSAAEIQTSEGNSLAAGDIPSGSVVNVISQDNATTPTWRLMNTTSTPGLLSADNTWKGDNTFTQDLLIDKASGVVSFRMRTTADSGFPHETYYTAHNASAADIDYANLSVQILDNTAASEDGEFIINTAQAGTTRPALKAQAGILIPDGNTDPTSGDLGSGWINARAGVARQGVEYSRGWTYTAQTATTSGTSVVLANDLAGLADAVEVEILFNGVATNTTGQSPLVRIGPSSGVVSTGYDQSQSTVSAGGAIAGRDTDGFYTLRTGSYAANGQVHGKIVLSRWDSAENLWQASGLVNTAGVTAVYTTTGFISLAGAMADIELTTKGATALFNNGEARIRYR